MEERHTGELDCRGQGALDVQVKKMSPLRVPQGKPTSLTIKTWQLLRDCSLRSESKSVMAASLHPVESTGYHEEKEDEIRRKVQAQNTILLPLPDA